MRIPNCSAPPKSHALNKQFPYNTYTALLENVEPKPRRTKTETYEDDAEMQFYRSRLNRLPLRHEDRTY